jgi:hypothetical protein
MNFNKAAGRARATRAVVKTALSFIVLMVGGMGLTSAETKEELEAEKVRQERIERLESFQGSQAQEEGEAEEEAQVQREEAMTAQLLLAEKAEFLGKGSTKEKQKLSEELKRYQKELLKFPKRDRLSYGGDFDMTYDSNVNRNIIRSEEGDTLFRVAPFARVDLGTRKSDLVVEFRGTKEYNVKVPEYRDFVKPEVTVRAGRKIGKKTTASLNHRLSADIRRDAEIDDDGKKVRYDNSSRVSFNHTLNRKLSLNLEIDYSRTDLPHELFDQDGTYSVQIDPNLFFHWTPKTRFSMGYRWSVSRPKTESTDRTSHEFRIGYSGKMTGG